MNLKEHDPNHGTDDEAEPEDPRFRLRGSHHVWRDLWQERDSVAQLAGTVPKERGLIFVNITQASASGGSEQAPAAMGLVSGRDQIMQSSKRTHRAFPWPFSQL